MELQVWKEVIVDKYGITEGVGKLEVLFYLPVVVSGGIWDGIILWKISHSSRRREESLLMGTEMEWELIERRIPKFVQNFLSKRLDNLTNQGGLGGEIFWVLRFRRGFQDWEVSEFQRLIDLLHSQANRWIFPMFGGRA